MCDNGSQVNLISQSIIQQLKEKPLPERTSFVGIGGNKLGTSLGEIWLSIQLKTGEILTEKFYVVKNITSYEPQSVTLGWDKLKGYLADENYNKKGKIHALLGAGIWIKIIEPEIVKSEDQLAVAHNSKLGYIILESRMKLNKSIPYIGTVTKKKESNIRLMQLIQKLWEIEELPFIPKRTKEEEKCESIFANYHSRDRFGRYIVRMPFNDKIKKLGKSRKLALKQFFGMETRMRKNPDFAEKYKAFMREYEALGHMEKIYEREEEGYYTPHHGVISATKFRVVFNASAATTTGVSLNDTQLVGEKLQRDLFITLINFRKFKYGITADIEKMYRQILIHPDDRKYQKILWRFEEKEPVHTYRLKTVTYGQACAPHSAIRALVQCANDHEKEYPTGASIVKQCFYVDDLLTGADDLPEVNHIKKEVTSLLLKGGFPITKWKTNGDAFENIELKDQEGESVLGLFWNLKTDKFFFKMKGDKTKVSLIWTKRKILSKIGQMYDPTGFLGPIIMRGKIIIQDLWRDKLDWDQEISNPIKEKWQEFNGDLQNIGVITINRWLGMKQTNKVQLHGFCDASEKGYGAVLYARTKREGLYQIELITSKSRVAPLKATTIPRLELCAANLLVNMIEIIMPIFTDSKVEFFCWSDSQITLQWMQKPSIDLKTYVANRISNIQSKNEKYHITWGWVSGADNPADLISRGTTIVELRNEDKWWHGPKWLGSSRQAWPSEQYSEPNIINHPDLQKEIKAIHLVTQPTDELMRGKWYKFDLNRQDVFPLIESYGTWKRLSRVLATVHRAIFNFKNPKSRRHGSLLPGELAAARRYAITTDQRKTFPHEMELAKSNPTTILGKLVVCWDKRDDCLRINCRVWSENLTRDEQLPIVLDKNGQLSPLLVRDAHGKTQHGGNQLVLQYLRSRYWIIGARKLIRGIINKCPICFKLRMQRSEQLMATLPTFRTTPKRAFSNVGIDYSGPVTVKSALGKFPKLTKAWIAVFVCLVTRAIHLELVSDSTTQAFIAAFKRMVARRGIISQVISDNGTNFVGANNYLRSIMEQIQFQAAEVEEEFNIKWTFTTPGAPHHGGIYEAAVKSVKHHLIRVIGETHLTFEEYSTVLCQAEACVNSRPICALNDDPTSLNALTPGHFLIGEALVRIPDEEDYREIATNRLDRWNHLQKMVQHFWDRWQSEYVGTLINRSKWLTQHRNFRVGDLVVVKEENLPPLKWKLGRIQEVVTSEDGLVRSVFVKTNTGVYKRPIVKLGLLISNEENNE